MARGTVKWFNSENGYGFIQPEAGRGKYVFVHISAVEEAGLSGLNEGQIVEYDEAPNKVKTSAETPKVNADVEAFFSPISASIFLTGQPRSVANLIWPFIRDNLARLASLMPLDSKQ